MEPAVTCDNCGCTDFYKEAGFYYCKECQIQSQDIQEHVFPEGQTELVKSRKIQSDKSTKTNNKLTSWEIYNYILLGLTEEMITLGASKQLKPAVRILWLKYLEKMQVFKRGSNRPPKLQAVNSKLDAEIIYGKSKKRRKTSTKSSSDETRPTSLSEESVRHDASKKKRALAQAHYEDLTQKSRGDSSLHNETLASLHSGSEKSSLRRINYNTYAERELKRKQGRCHLKRHREDFDYHLKCHRLTYRNFSKKYRRSPYVLSLNKLYAIIYLGLLIVQDKWQLGDLLRFINQGDLSFNSFDHFFPDEVKSHVHFQNFNKKNSNFSHEGLRTVACDIAKMLQVSYYVTRPNLVQLGERYCNDLNLPKRFTSCVQKIITSSNPKMLFNDKSTQVPNYEGRVLGLIVFTLKLLFGLDDVSEFASSRPGFNVIHWLKYLDYRHLVIANDSNLSLLNLLLKKRYPEVNYKKNKDDYHQVLSKLKNQSRAFVRFHYPVSETPILDTVRLLAERNVTFMYDRSLLLRDFSRDRINLSTIPRGAINRIVEPITCPKIENYNKHKCAKKLVTVKLSLRNFKPKKTRPKKVIGRPAQQLFKVDSCSYYWIRIKLRTDYVNCKELEQFHRGLPDNFKVVFRECLKMSQQSKRDLLGEFQFTELFLAHRCDFGMKKRAVIAPLPRDGRLLNKFLTKAEHLW